AERIRKSLQTTVWASRRDLLPPSRAFPALLFVVALVRFVPLEGLLDYVWIVVALVLVNTARPRAVVVTLLRFYFSLLTILVGTELNAEIEHASPCGKDPASTL